MADASRRKVAVLTTETRNWTRVVALYATRAEAERAVLDLLDDEYGERVATYDAAVGRLASAYGWSITIDECELPR
jgi:hypothetical protein